MNRAVARVWSNAWSGVWWGAWAVVLALGACRGADHPALRDAAAPDGPPAVADHGPAAADRDDAPAAADAAEPDRGSPPPTTPPPPGCGLPAAAFCDTFESASPTIGRAGELDPARWSGGRLAPQLPTGGAQTFAVGPATLPACRAGLPPRVFPDRDALICDPSAGVQSRHLLVATASQNYGLNSYRVRQPFDFAARTGKIVFDAEGYTRQLLGWISLDVTEDPIAVPSYALITNDEGGILPRNGFELQFSYPCVTASPTFSLSAVHVFHDYADTVTYADYRNPRPSACVAAQAGRLNHFEVLVSQTKISVYVTPFSSDGVTFAAPQLMFEAPVDLPFSRGYVHIGTHNHATIKYSENNAMDAWVARWDNVGFDGPVVGGWRESEVPDALVPTADGAAMNIGYRVPDQAQAQPRALRFPAVSLEQATGARIALSAWYLQQDGSRLDQYALRYRLNGHGWHERRLTAGEISAVTAPIIVGGNPTGSQGALAQLLDVPLEELIAGENLLELTTANVPQNYPPAVLNVDLVLTGAAINAANQR